MAMVNATGDGFLIETEINESEYRRRVDSAAETLTIMSRPKEKMN